MEPGEPKFIISRDVVFDKTRMAMEGTADHISGKTDMSSEGDLTSTRIEVELPSHQTCRQDTDQIEVLEENQAEPTINDYNLVRDRARGNIVPPRRFGYADLICYVLNIAEDIHDSEPTSFNEALESEDRQSWLTAMAEEIESLKRNNTWTLVDLPKNQKVVRCKWIFKRKEGIPGVERARFKARLVARGFSQVEGVDFTEIFSPVVKHCSIRILLALVTQFNLELEQLDVKTAFLHGELEETIYMHQPEGFVEDKGKVCLLKKSPYGLRQSPRQWNKRFDEFMRKMRFERSNYDSCVYFLKRNGKAIIYLLLYVDDILITSTNKAEISQLKAELNSEFDMKELGVAKRILGMDIIRDRQKGELVLSQQTYVKKVLRRFRMHESKLVSTPLGHLSKLSLQQSPNTDEERARMTTIPYASGVGSIMYGMVCSRPDLAHAVSVISRFMADPGQEHWEALKWVLRYLNDSCASGLRFKRKLQEVKAITGYVDSDFAGNIDTKKSLSRYVLTLFGTAISWKPTLQSVVALSSTQAEYVALTEGIKEALWLKGMVDELGIAQDSITLYCDHQSAIHLSKHQVYHERSKHIDVKLHFIRDIIDSKKVHIKKIASEENPADAFTKSLPTRKFKLCLDLIGLCDN